MKVPSEWVCFVLAANTQYRVWGGFVWLLVGFLFFLGGLV